MPNPIANLYPQAPDAINPLAVAGQVANLSNLQNQNRLFSQEFGSRQAIGEAYRQATNPQTGETDFGRVMGLASQDPRANYRLGELAAQALERQKNQLEIQTKNFDLELKRANRVSQVIGAHLAELNSSSPDEVLKNIGGSLADFMTPDETGKPLMTPQQAAVEYMAASTASGQGKLQQHLMQEWLKTSDAKTALDAKMGQLQLINRGPVTDVYRNSALGGMEKLGGLSMGMSPDTASTPTPAFVNGQPVNMTRAQFMQMSGGGNPMMGGGGGGNALGVQQRMPSIGVPSGPALGVSTAADKDAGFSAEQGNDLFKTANDVPTRKAVLNNMLGALQKFEPGPGSDTTRTIKAGVQRLAPDFIWPEGVKDSVAAQEEFSKFAKQLAVQQSESLGAGTDEKLMTAMGANPNADLSKLGNQRVLHILLGNEDAIAAKNLAWQSFKQQNGPQSYQQFSTQFNQSFDPRIFQMRYLSPDERKSEFGKLSKAEQASFLERKNLLQQAGLLGGR